MRLLVVSNLYPPAVRGGYELECQAVVEHLLGSHEVTVLTSRTGAGSADPFDVRRELPWTGGLTPRDVALAPLHAAAGVRTVRRVVADVRPDAIWLWNGAGIPTAAVRAVQDAGPPVLVRVCEHWFAELGRQDQLTRYLPGGDQAPPHAVSPPHRVLGAAARTVNRLPGLQVETQRPLRAAVSWNSAFLRAAAPPPAGVEVVLEDVTPPSSAQVDRLLQVPRAPVPGRILFVGRLDARKGVHTAIRALARVRAEDPALDATLVAAGRGSEEELAAARTLAAACGVGDHVAFPGLLRGAALEAEVSAASAWTVPSVWAEPAGLVAIEAAAARVPAVLSRVGGIPELLADGKQALFHDPEDEVGCATALVASLRGGPEVDARVAAAASRARELATAPYLARMDRFLDEGLAALS